MKDIKLNFNLNEKTSNGRLYNADNFLYKMNEQIKNATFFFEYSGKYSSMEVDLGKIIGFVESCEVKKNGDVFFKVIALNKEDDKYLNVIDDCALSATGYVDKNGNTLISNIVCLRPSPEYSLAFNDLELEEGIEVFNQG